MFLSRLIASIRDLTREIIRLRKVIGLRRPGLVFSRMVFEGESSVSKFVLVLPAPGAADVVQRELVFSVAGGEPVTQLLSGSALESDEFSGNQGDIVTGSLVDIDDATPSPNRSEPSLFELELVDTIAPPQPGQVGLKMTAEE